MPRSQFSQKPNVVIGLPHSLPFIESIIAGARAVFIRQLGRVAHVGAGSVEDTLAMVNRFHAAGCITVVHNTREGQMWADTGIPTVNVSGRCDDPVIPTVTMDNQQVGELAARHLLHRGYRRLVFIVESDLAFVEPRRRGFVEAAESEGISAEAIGRERALETIVSGELPVGVLAGDDPRGMRLIDELRDAGLTVPGDAAVMSINNVAELCESYEIPLTSVDPGGRQIGIEAARLLCRLMDDQPAPDGPILVRPAGVVARASTGLVAVDDPVVREALDFITQHAREPITADDILERVPVSRRTLETKFSKTLGWSPHAELHRVRLENAKELLRTTDLPVVDIARHCGYSNASRFYTRFRKSEGMTPGMYRGRHTR
jgi:LacI family transcriptional regulator